MYRGRGLELRRRAPVSTAAATAPATSPWGKRLGAIAVLAALLAALRFLPIEHWLLDFVAWVRDAGARGIAAFVIAYVVLGLVIPGSVLTLGAGFAYGVVLGTAVVWVAANLTAVVAFILGRTLARDAIAARVGANPRFAAIDRAIGREGLKIVLLVRLSPIFPFTLLNYALGLTRVAVRDYVIGSLIGMLPGTLMYVYLGSLVTSLTELAAGRPSGGALAARRQVRIDLARLKVRSQNSRNVTLFTFKVNGVNKHKLSSS